MLFRKIVRFHFLKKDVQYYPILLCQDSAKIFILKITGSDLILIFWRNKNH